jgi:hypothetical protein
MHTSRGSEMIVKKNPSKWLPNYVHSCAKTPTTRHVARCREWLALNRCKHVIRTQRCDDTAALRDTEIRLRSLSNVPASSEVSMKSNLKVILPTVGVAASLVWPAMAMSASRHHTTVYHYPVPTRGYVPGGAYNSPPASRPATGDAWCAIRHSWDACHDPRENAHL